MFRSDLDAGWAALDPASLRRKCEQLRRAHPDLTLTCALISDDTRINYLVIGAARRTAMDVERTATRQGRPGAHTGDRGGLAQTRLPALLERLQADVRDELARGRTVSFALQGDRLGTDSARLAARLRSITAAAGPHAARVEQVAESAAFSDRADALALLPIIGSAETWRLSVIALSASDQSVRNQAAINLGQLLDRPGAAVEGDLRRVIEQAAHMVQSPLYTDRNKGLALLARPALLRRIDPASLPAASVQAICQSADSVVPQLRDDARTIVATARLTCHVTPDAGDPACIRLAMHP